MQLHEAYVHPLFHHCLGVTHKLCKGWPTRFFEDLMGPDLQVRVVFHQDCRILEEDDSQLIEESKEFDPTQIDLLDTPSLIHGQGFVYPWLNLQNQGFRRHGIASLQVVVTWDLRKACNCPHEITRQAAEVVVVNTPCSQPPAREIYRNVSVGYTT